MWEINNLSQLTAFLYSAVLGCGYCILYDVFRAVRKVYMSSAFSIFWQDIVFSLLCAFSCFCFLLTVTNGELRMYVIFGICLGFALCRLTVSRVLFFILRNILGLLKRFFSGVGAFLSSVFLKTENFLKKQANTFKKLLKKARGLLYTKHNRKAVSLPTER